MTAAALFLTFFVLFVLGAPIAVALGLAGSAAIWLADLGVLAVPTSTYTGIAKYPLLAIPMFVLLGALFDRSGVAAKLVAFTAALIGRRPGALAAVTVIVAMMLGGISGSGPANAAAVGGAMMGALSRAGYPRAFSASVIGAAAATDILIPPSIALIIYSVLVPQASVPALFAAGMIPGIMATMTVTAASAPGRRPISAAVKSTILAATPERSNRAPSSTNIGMASSGYLAMPV